MFRIWRNGELIGQEITLEAATAYQAESEKFDREQGPVWNFKVGRHWITNKKGHLVKSPQLEAA